MHGGLSPTSGDGMLLTTANPKYRVSTKTVKEGRWVVFRAKLTGCGVLGLVIT